MTSSHDERLALCDDALAAGPDAPTLCDGWTVADLVAHLYIRENDPLAALGVVIPALKDFTARRMSAALTRYGFAGLVKVVRNGPGRWSPFRLFEEAANSLEMYVHHEDIRRAGADPSPRDLGVAVENDLWGRIGMARMAFRKSPVGVVLERSDMPGTTLRAKPGTRTVTLVAPPSELILYAFGRQTVADVRFVGDPETVAGLEHVHIGM
ncbi:MAG: TIGR03085 family metal-binding protein [Propionibacteriaceae bacterium]